ncbi:hypothetical protein EZV62_011652 [Acer yangbiense]|uniref:NADH dehydrogenase [ubiquinone] 1 beta subcomplex subunit 9 n=1 Tax=Acer yangbiense TaxID=1000413 RepID=A0A5C7I6L4_9ROSI|nr:hypothetical protein EZV62_011652 [Acer yangbiense]
MEKKEEAKRCELGREIEKQKRRLIEREREREMSSAVSTTAYLARRAAQKERVRILYRRALKDTLNWAADDLREKFEANKHVSDLDTIDRLIDNAEATYNNFRHPDPYIVFVIVEICSIFSSGAFASFWHNSAVLKAYTIFLSAVPWAPGGSKFCRNPTPPAGVIFY